jgi:hypothetical protein
MVGTRLERDSKWDLGGQKEGLVGSTVGTASGHLGASSFQAVSVVWPGTVPLFWDELKKGRMLFSGPTFISEVF